MPKATTRKLTPEERLAEALVPESEQPYPVPDNWVWVKGSSCLLKMTTKKPSGESFQYIDIDSIDNNNQTVIEPKTLSVSNAPSRASREVCYGDTLFSMVRPYLRNIAYIDENLTDCIASTGFFVCKPSSLINSRYLYGLMISNYMVDGLNKFMKGDNSPSIRQDNILEFPFPLPPLPEQHRIVERIESLFEKLDGAKKLAQTALDTFETRKTAILHKAFTGQLTSKWREENGVGMDSWEERYLDDCGTWYGGGTPSKAVASFWHNGDIIWVTSKDMKQVEITDSEIKITRESLSLSSARLIEKPAVLFVMRSGILRRVLPVCMTRQSVTINQDLRAVVPHEDIFLDYLCWYCIGREKDIREKCFKSGTTVESIRSDALNKYIINLPTLPEQQEIVRILDNLLEKEKTAQTLCDVIEKIDLMKKAILARAFRGELGTNDPGEESAVGLL